LDWFRQDGTGFGGKELNEIVTDSLEQVEASRGTEDEQNQKWLEKLPEPFSVDQLHVMIGVELF